jgi:hypothetical protein
MKFAIIATPYTYPNFLNKGNDPLRMQVLNYFGYLSIFIDVSENLVMADDVATPLNPSIPLVEKEELEKIPFDVNVFQWSCEEKSSRRVVRTQVDCSEWDRQLSPNPHALAIYLEFVLACGVAPKRVEECQCEDDDVRLHCRI